MEFLTPSSITVQYSDIEGGEEGIVTNGNGTVYWMDGNIDDDPSFMGTGYHPNSLLDDSPCIDTGIPDPAGLDLPAIDLMGNHRIWDGDGDGILIIDMGAYEYGSEPYVDVEENMVETPGIHLDQNYPNPFKPAVAGRGPGTTISFSFTAKDAQDAKLEIYNVKGQKVKTFAVILSGVEGSATWNGKDDSGKSVPSGIYLYRLKTEDDSKIKKMTLLR